ncbi:MAG: Arm DNA-binding domain-containing protein, partial [Deltaproteobacteria bacterium]|nr:Arm DNA-binding domain-containing protein [Deltaproteobacteria bacterium]
MTDFQIKSLKARDKLYKVADGAGLYLVITPAGNKIWRYNYQFEGKGKTLTFGQYPVVELKEARNLLI